MNNFEHVRWENSISKYEERHFLRYFVGDKFKCTLIDIQKWKGVSGISGSGDEFHILPNNLSFLFNCDKKYSSIEEAKFEVTKGIISWGHLLTKQDFWLKE